MGYTTDFKGSFKLNKQLTLDDYRWLQDFAKERHESEGFPGIWCQWVPSYDGWSIVWDEGEKFYEYVEWLKWLIQNFFTPRSYVLNGEVFWQGEQSSDVGKIIVKDNSVTSKEGRIVFAG